MNSFVEQGFTYVAPSVLEEMSKPHARPTARSPRRPRYVHQNDQCRLTPGMQQGLQTNLQTGLQTGLPAGLQPSLTPFAQRGMTSKQTPPHLQQFARPSPQDEIMEVQGVPIV